MLSVSLCPSSWLLCHHIHPWSWRQTLGQSATDKDRWGRRVLSDAAYLTCYMMEQFQNIISSSREAVPHRLRLHPGSGPQTAASAHEAEQRDGGGDGGHAERAVPGVQEAVLHRLPAPQEVRGDTQIHKWTKDISRKPPTPNKSLFWSISYKTYSSL